MSFRISVLGATAATLSLFALSACGTASASGSATTAAAFFKGKTVTLIAPDAAGGGYDMWDRLVAPYLAQAMGAKQVNVVNVPQAGTIAGTNEMASSKPDGLTLGDVNVGGDIGNLLEKAPGQKFNLTQLTWLAAPTSEPEGMFTQPSSPFHSFADLLKLKQSGQTANVLDTRSGAGDLTNRVVLGVFGIPHKLLTGYGSSKDLEAGFLRGDGQLASVTYTSWQTLVKSHKAMPLLVTTMAASWAPNPQAETLGTAAKQAHVTAQQTKALQTLANISSLAFDFAGPPGIPADRVAFLRHAFQQALSNPGLIAKAKSEGLTVQYMDGQTLAQEVQTTIQNDQSIASYLQ